MNDASSSRAHREANPAGAALEHWEAEGGALPHPVARDVFNGLHASSATTALLLQFLGKALVCEWPDLPTAVQRAVYERAVGGHPLHGGPGLKRRMARFLHDHSRRPPEASG